MLPSARFEDALLYATRLHAHQLRKSSKTPYVAHLYAVMALVLEAGGSEDEAIAALLHDAVEDQGGISQLEEIRRRFGEQVAAIVDGCTDAYSQPKPPWHQRKTQYIAHVQDPNTSNAVLLVSTADKLHNARSTLYDYRRQGEAFWQDFNAGREDTLWYFRSLTNAFLAREVPLAEELNRVVCELETLISERQKESKTEGN